MFCHERDTVQIMHCLTTLVRDNNAMRESSSSVKKKLGFANHSVVS